MPSSEHIVEVGVQDLSTILPTVPVLGHSTLPMRLNFVHEVVSRPRAIHYASPISTILYISKHSKHHQTRFEMCKHHYTPIVFKKKLPQLLPFLLHHCCVEMPNVSLGKVVIQNEDRHFRQTRLAPGTRVLRLSPRSYRDQIGNVMFICIEKKIAGNICWFLFFTK